MKSFYELPITRFPNIDVPIISVSVSQNGAAPAELETQVTKEVEDAVAGIAGVDFIQSTVNDGVSTTAIMDARLSVANDRLNTAPQRVAKYLLELWRSQGGPGNPFRLPFQKSLLAGKLGLAPEALSRAFSTLKKSGVTVRGRIVQVNDVAALKQI